MLTIILIFLGFGVRSTTPLVEQKNSLPNKYFVNDRDFDEEIKSEGERSFLLELFRIHRHSNDKEKYETYMSSLVKSFVEVITDPGYKTPTKALKTIFGYVNEFLHYLLCQKKEITEDVFDKARSLFKLESYIIIYREIIKEEGLNYNDEFQRYFYHVRFAIKMNSNPEKNFGKYKTFIENLIKNNDPKENRIETIRENYMLLLFCHYIDSNRFYNCFRGKINLITYFNTEATYSLFNLMAEGFLKDKLFAKLFQLFCFIRINMACNYTFENRINEMYSFNMFFNENYPRKPYCNEFKLSNLDIIVDFYEINRIQECDIFQFVAKNLIYLFSITPSNTIYFIKESLEHKELCQIRNIMKKEYIKDNLVRTFKRLSIEKKHFINLLSFGRYFSSLDFFSSDNVIKNLEFVEDIMSVFNIRKPKNYYKNEIKYQFSNFGPSRKEQLNKEYLKWIEEFLNPRYNFSSYFEEIYFLSLFKKVFKDYLKDKQLKEVNVGTEMEKTYEAFTLNFYLKNSLNRKKHTRVIMEKISKRQICDYKHLGRPENIDS